jgi:hypothetical protein
LLAGSGGSHSLAGVGCVAARSARLCRAPFPPNL